MAYDPMTGVLVTGATGKTGTALVTSLRARGVTVRAASRHPSAQDPDAVPFDWAESTTHSAALHGVDRVYLVPPPSALDPLEVVEPFLAEARRAGVRRLVLLGSAIVFPGAPGRVELAGQVRQQPGWVVLRPSGFMQNFLPPHPLGQGIRLRAEIRTSAGEGRVSWIDVHDVAEAAAAPLSDPDLDSGDDYRLTGPEALSDREAAAILTAASAAQSACTSSMSTRWPPAIKLRGCPRRSRQARPRLRSAPDRRRSTDHDLGARPHRPPPGILRGLHPAAHGRLG